MILGLFVSSMLFAQEAEADSLPSWKQERKLGILINQSSFDNWLAGGVNSFSGTLNFDYDLAYQNEKWNWTTTLDAALGYAKNMGDDYFNKTEDQLEINTILLRKRERAINFSSSFNLKTQNAPGNNFIEQEGDIERVKTSGFFSPAYMRLGVGIAFKKDDLIALQFNPLNARLIVVDQMFTRNLAVGETFFGVAADKTTRWEAGASFALQSKITIAKNVVLSNNLSLVANYLEEFKNIDLDFTSTLNMKVNEYLSAILEAQILYDDNALADLQFRQVFGLAVSLPF
ncbi:MAG: DUF3078 domain-containing protein [Candidatus Arcticimaribacter sp.]